MDYLLNELSLVGQYADSDRFAIDGVKPILGVLKTLADFGVNSVLKKSSFTLLEISPGKPLYELFKTKQRDSVRAVYAQLARMQTSPFWDDNSMQEKGKCYFLHRKGSDETTEVDVTGTGVAESYSRKGCLISFKGAGYDEKTVAVRKEDEDGYNNPAVVNLHDSNDAEKFLFESGAINCQAYIKSRFCRKFIYDELSEKQGLNLVSSANFRQFFLSFRDFEEYSWQQIQMSDGFEYKPFHKNRYTQSSFSNEQWNKGINKFRVNDEIRCFGYREGDKFHLLKIDLNHILSDNG